MELSELIILLQELEAKGKGDYKIVDAGYMNEITLEDIEIDDKRKEIII